MDKHKDFKATVAIDLDGTIIDSYSPLTKIISVNTGLNITVNDLKEWNKDFGNYKMSDAFDELFSNDNALKNLKSFKFAPDVINRFYNNDIKVVIVTAREPKYKTHTLYNLSKNNIPFHKYYFRPKGDKYNIKEQNVNILIDDGPHFIKEFLINRPNSYGIIMQRPWNQNRISKLWDEINKCDAMKNLIKNRIFIVKDWLKAEEIVYELLQNKIEKNNITKNLLNKNTYEFTK